MQKRDKISLSVIRRLPRYYRFLDDLRSNDILRISSRELSERMGITASQIRQDLNCFGEFGQQGYGYNVDLLYNEICKILGVEKGYKTIMIGAGNLGRAIATHMNFGRLGFNLIGIFDNNEYVIGKKLMGIEILPNENLESFCGEYNPAAAILCIPKDSAQEMCDQLIHFGIIGFWNFSHYDLGLLNPNIVVENVHLGDSLMILSYRMQKQMEDVK